MMKRAFDIAVSVPALVLLSPILAVLAIAVRLDSPGPSFYKACRVGRFGREFMLYKFRTMVTDADQHGPGITLAQDARVTRIGRMLRRTKLDELPQFFNVLKGNMSLVGPRPEDAYYVAMYTPAQRAILNVRPGITSLASVRYRHEDDLLVGPNWETTYIQQVMPAKIAIDLEYLEKATPLTDLRLLFQTALALFK
jgi:lipopolysaccharide/colanic/teichoic acid biosynthesis glycosyltransferase